MIGSTMAMSNNTNTNISAVNTATPIHQSPFAIDDSLESPYFDHDGDGVLALDSVRQNIADRYGIEPQNDGEDDFDCDDDTPSHPQHNAQLTIPPGKDIMLRKMFRRVWDCDTPRPYQLEALYHLLFKDEVEMMYLIRKTGEGKSNVLLGMATLLKGITLSLVPLLGLGSDQSQKATKTSFIGFEAHHVDEYRDEVAEELMTQLEEYSSLDKDKTAILIYISPQLLQPTSKWYQLFAKLAQRGFLSSICIDEVHTAVQNYVSFRPEFKTAVESINSLVKIAKGLGKRVPILAMSATFTTRQQKAFSKLIHRTPSIIIWGNMDKRSVGFHTTVAGNPMHALIKDWEGHVIDNPSKQALIYSNSASKCDGQILNSLRKARLRLPDDVQKLLKKSRFIALTGSCGVMLKSFLIESFCRDQPGGVENDNSSIGEEFNDDEDGDGTTSPTSSTTVQLPRILCMPCTSAANCGVSSNRCNKCYRLGPPPNFHDMVQEMGRVNRSNDAISGQHAYYIYLNVPTFLELWLRIQSEPVQSVRLEQESDLLNVLKTLVLPDRCYHDVIEEYFENPLTHVSRGRCGGNCTYCTKAHTKISGSISKVHLISTLTIHVFDKGAVPSEKLLAFLSSKKSSQHKKNIWNAAPSTITPGQVHGLVLMLVAAKIIHVRISAAGDKLRCQKQLTTKHLEFVLGKEVVTINGEESDVFSYSVDSNWKLFTSLQSRPNRPVNQQPNSNN